MVSKLLNLFRKKDDEHAVARNLSSDFVDGELDAETEASVKSHLEWCPPCQSFVNTLRATIGLLGSSQPPETPDGFRERLDSKLDAEKHGRA